MANQFIVNLSTADGLPLAAGAVTGSLDLSLAPYVGDGTDANIPVDTVTGSGSGATATIVVSGGSMAATTMTIVLEGDDYKVGDEISVDSTDAAIWTGTISYTILAADLVTADSETQALVPVDYALFVQLGDSAAGTVEMRQIQPEHDRYWKFSLNGGDSNNADAILLAVNAAMRRAMQATHSDPILELPNGVTCYDVALS